MRPFSERMGLRKPPEVKLDDIGQAMRNALWNAFYSYIKQIYSSTWGFMRLPDDIHDLLRTISYIIWKGYFGYPLDEIDNGIYDISASYLHPKVFEEVRRLILNEGEWYDVYDFLEFVANISAPNPTYEEVLETPKENFVKECNMIFEAFGNLYVFEKIDNSWLIIPKISEYEMKEISQAIINEKIPEPTRRHLIDAVELYKMRENPKYAESIGESIKAVESLIRYIHNDNNITLSNGIDKLSKCLDKHLREAIKNIYWKTSDDWGARHGFGPGDSEPDIDDARLVLVLSSAIVNYLSEKVLNNPECRGEDND